MIQILLPVVLLSATSIAALPVISEPESQLLTREPLPFTDEELAARGFWKSIKKIGKKYGKAALKVGHMAVDVAAATGVVPGAGVVSGIAGQLSKGKGRRELDGAEESVYARAPDASSEDLTTREPAVEDDLFTREANAMVETLIARYLESEEGIQAREVLGEELDARANRVTAWLRKKAGQAKKALSRVTVDDVVTTTSKVASVLSHGQSTRYHRRDLEGREIVPSYDELD